MYQSCEYYKDALYFNSRVLIVQYTAILINVAGLESVKLT